MGARRRGWDGGGAGRSREDVDGDGWRAPGAEWTAQKIVLNRSYTLLDPSSPTLLHFSLPYSTLFYATLCLPTPYLFGTLLPTTPTLSNNPSWPHPALPYPNSTLPTYPVLITLLYPPLPYVSTLTQPTLLPRPTLPSPHSPTLPLPYPTHFLLYSSALDLTL